MARKAQIVWLKEDIKCELAKRKFTLSAVADLLGVKRCNVSLVLAGRRSEKIEVKIAELLDVAPEDIWPDRKYPARRLTKAAG